MKWFSKFLQDRQRPPLRTPTDDHDVKGGSNLGSQRGEQQVAIDNAGIKKPSARERLDRLPKLRTEANTITFNALGANKGGGKGDVAHATWKRRMWNRKEQVAVKKIRYHSGTDSHMFANAFVHEVEVMAGLSHENIVRLLGFIEDLDNGKAWIIMSWEPNGNVSEFLTTGKWEIPERISLIQDTFEGLRYLHTRQPPICHGDLKSLNILVSASRRAVITDFGSARLIRESGDGEMGEARGEEAKGDSTREEDYRQINVIPDGHQLTLTGPAWSLRWAPPEVVNGNHPGLSSDVWSAGWVCWEIMTNKLPFSDLDSGTAIMFKVIEGEVPSASEDKHLSQIVTLCNLMTDCWAMNPQERPTISRCCDEVKWVPSIPPGGGAPSDSRGVANRLFLQIGRTHYLHAKYVGAASVFQRVLDGANGKEDRKERAEALYWLGTVSVAQCKYPEAEEFCKEARDTYALIGDQMGQANSLRGLGDIYHLQSKLGEAEGAFARAQEIYDTLNDDRGRASALCGLGHIFRVRSDYNQAKEMFGRSHDIYARIGDGQGRANALQGLGSVYRLQSNWTEAETAFSEARTIYARMGDDPGQADALLGLGGLSCDRSEYEEAESRCTQALEIHVRIGNHRGQANALYGLGKVYLGQSRYPEAVTTFDAAKKIYSRIGSVEGQANTFHSLGEAYRRQSELDAATSSYTEAQELYAQIGNKEGQADVTYNHGEVVRLQKNYTKATELFIKAQELYDNLGKGEGQCAALCRLGELYRLLLQSDQAIWSYTTAQELYGSMGDDERRASVSCNLGELYRDQTKYDKATALYTEAQ